MKEAVLCCLFYYGTLYHSKETALKPLLLLMRRLGAVSLERRLADNIQGALLDILLAMLFFYSRLADFLSCLQKTLYLTLNTEN